VRGTEELHRLKGCGCDAALVATALHDGRITAADVAALRLGHDNVAR
jgi:phosphoribosylformimino-5-aminoimidazole carboxamide ribotide isomerase